MDAATPKPEKWQRWSREGRFRLYLSGGNVLEFTGQVRTKTNADGITDYEGAGDHVAMFPHISDVIAIDGPA